MTLPVSLTDATLRVLIISPSFALRNSFACALEDDGRPTIEAASAEEALWHLVSACDVGPIDLILADPGTPGVVTLLTDLRGSQDAPALILIGRATDPRLLGEPTIVDPTNIEVVRETVEWAAAER